MAIKKENIIIINEKLESMFLKLAEKRHENLEMMIEDLFFKGLGIQIHQQVSDEKIESGNRCCLSKNSVRTYQSESR